MAEPTRKHPAIEGLLNDMADRTASIKGNRCVKPPIGCGGPAVTFDSELSLKEYRISGLCQKCQDTFFGKDPA